MIPTEKIDRSHGYYAKPTREEMIEGTRRRFMGKEPHPDDVELVDGHFVWRKPSLRVRLRRHFSKPYNCILLVLFIIFYVVIPFLIFRAGLFHID